MRGSLGHFRAVSSYRYMITNFISGQNMAKDDDDGSLEYQFLQLSYFFLSFVYLTLN